MKTNFLFSLLVTVVCTSTVFSQGLVDGFFNPKGDLSVTASYTRSTFDTFYVGKVKADPIPAHNEIEQDLYNLYAKYSITDNLTVIANVPYINAQGNGVADPVNGTTEQSDFQDISLYGKYRAFSTKIGKTRLDGLGAVGVTLPSGYEPNGILSLGSGAVTSNLHLGAHLQADSGLFATAVAGYSLRGNADDNIGVNGGNDLDVPDALLFMGKIGYSNALFYVEAWMDYQSSTDGRDISDADFGGRFPETEVDYTRIGVTAYVPVLPSLGLSAGYGTLVDGRNVGDSNYFNLGVTYSLSVGSKKVK
ncbi:hypothetical protein [uncultured Nonlabens sp.]|uniref:hypothetical protein n=1 Tax=uncultured Nonlabens sp. TaxID=859306 RepID=UPI002625A795|nr:hypothetical protein [uncultured Nonlabens sp.]